MSDRSETRKRNQLLESIYQWQKERQLEGWNDDQLRGEIGIVITEDFIVISEDGQIEFELEGEGSERTFRKYTVKRNDHTGMHVIEKEGETIETEESIEESTEEDATEEEE